MRGVLSRAAVQHSLVHRHSDVQAAALVVVQIAVGRATSKTAGHLHHSAPATHGVVVSTSCECQEASSVASVHGVAGRQRHVAAVPGVAGPDQHVDVAAGVIGTARRVGVDQNWHGRRSLHQDCSCAVHLQALVSLVVALSQEQRRLVAGTVGGIVILATDGDVLSLPRTDLNPLVTAALARVKSQRARGGSRSIFGVQTRDLWHTRLFLDDQVLLLAHVHALCVRVLEHHAVCRHEAAVHSQITKNIRAHSLGSAAANPDVGCTCGSNANHALLGLLVGAALARVDDHVAAGAGFGRAALQDQRAAVARVAVATRHRHVATPATNGLATSDFNSASVASRAALSVARHHDELAARAFLGARAGARCDEHTAALLRVGVALASFYHHSSAVLGVARSHQQVHVPASTGHRRPRGQRDPAAVSDRGRTGLDADLAAHTVVAARLRTHQHLTT
mmetsp:Transcript_6237/g.25842  ORF Transcript_6237/g.25842 Transcript_6237/m.25842 type:complete len:451 (+) Transcript_6237:1040-2392(+)